MDKRGINLKITHPDLARQFDNERNKILIENISRGTNKKVWWKCDKGNDHRWEAGIKTRAWQKTGCPFCSGRRATSTNNLAISYTHLLLEWNYEKNGNPLEYILKAEKKRTIILKILVYHDSFPLIHDITRIVGLGRF